TLRWIASSLTIGDSGLWFEADLLAHRLGKTFELASMFVQDADDLRHLRFDACEAFGALTFKLQVTPIGLRQATAISRLVLDQSRLRFFEPIAAVRRRAFSRHGRLRSLGDTRRGSRSYQSGRSDSNRRLSAPKADALGQTALRPVRTHFFQHSGT